MNSVLIVFVIFLLFLFIDLPVILYFNRSLYEKMFEQINQGKTQHSSKTYLSGLVVYVLLSIGLYYFVIKPFITISSIKLGIRHGLVSRFIMISIFFFKY